MRLGALALLLALLAGHAWALEAGEALSDSRLEQRAVAVGEQLRCLVCQGESVNDSPSRLAQNMRALIRTRLLQGWSEKKITAYLQGRYGDYILLKPPLKPATLPLWLTPWVVLGLALAFYGFYLSKTKKGRQR